MRIMTNNIWGDYFGNEVESRQDNLFAVYEKYSPDILGFQEVTESWHKSALFEKLEENYHLIGIEKYNWYNFVPIAVKKSLEVISFGFERLHGASDKSKSICYVVAENKDTGNRIAVCNTHFWWMQGNECERDKRMLKNAVGEKIAYQSPEEHNALRTKNAKQLAMLMAELKEKFNCPVIAMGDMNTTISSDVFRVYEERGISHFFDKAKERDTVCSVHGNPLRGEDGKFHGKKTTEDYTSSIDHIIGLGNGYNVLCYRVIEDKEALDATDHSPVYADIDLM